MSLNAASRLVLRPGVERRILDGGHDWIFSNEVERFSAEKESLVVDVFSAVGQWLALALYNPSSLICGRIISRVNVSLDEKFWLERLSAAWKRRLNWYPGEVCFRWIYGESDGIPGLIADRYGQYLILEVTSKAMEGLLSRLIPLMNQVFLFEGILFRRDNSLRQWEGLGLFPPEVLWGHVPDHFVEVSIDGMRCLVDFWKGQKTGYFLDQRDNRRLLASLAAGKKVLDLYCHSGAFGLSLVKAGASSCLLVDSSPLAIDLSLRQAQLNAMADQVAAVRSDVEKFLSTNTEKYDLIVVDPPNLAPKKKDATAALRKFRKVLEAAMPRLADEGFLAAATCSHHIGLNDFLGMVHMAAQKVGMRFRIFEIGQQAKDHPVLLSMPETLYLKFVLLERLSD